MNQAQIASERRYNVLKGVWPHACTIQIDTKTRGASGGVLQTWSDITGLVGIPCLVRDAKISKRDITAGSASSVVVIIGKRVMIGTTHDGIQIGHKLLTGTSAYIITDVVIDRCGIYTDVGVELWQKQ